MFEVHEHEPVISESLLAVGFNVIFSIIFR